LKNLARNLNRKRRETWKLVPEKLEILAKELNQGNNKYEKVLFTKYTF